MRNIKTIKSNVLLLKLSKINRLILKCNSIDFTFLKSIKNIVEIELKSRSIK